jgi:TRAP-type C4-dicarboxylate transport system substrate-binding protein
VKRAVVLALVLAGSPAPAKTILRMATIAPDGTAWAREIRSFANEVAEATQNDIGFKLYFGGIAGDDLQSLERVKRGQLDGLGSVTACEKIGPSLRVTRIPALFRNRDEARHVAKWLRPTLEQEFAQNGFVYLGHSIVGEVMVAARRPVRNLAELKATKLWSWDIDVVTTAVYREMGLNLMPAPIDSASSLYSDGRIDGFLAMPAAMLAFQWSAQAHHMTEVGANYLVACLVFTDKVISKLPLPQQQIMRSATAKLAARLDAVGAEQDEKLMNGLFGRQGLRLSPVSDSFREDFWREAKAASDRLGEKLVPKELLQKVNQQLTEYRAQHPEQAKR